MPKPHIPAAVVLTGLLAFLGGGLAGSIFNWLINKPKPTIIIYSTTTATLAAAESAPFIPNLHIEVGADQVKSLYLHTIEFSGASGPFVQQADIAVEFPSKVHIYGLSTEAPNSVHSLDCAKTDFGLRCKLMPVSVGTVRPYKVSIASDLRDEPTATLAAKDITLMSADEYYLASTASIWQRLFTFRNFGMLLATGIWGGLVWYTYARITGRIAGKSIVVGKVLSPNGIPVGDAQVEVEVEHPAGMGSIATTDAMGDFLVGLKKQPLFRAKLRISAPNYPVAEFETNSAIVIYQFPRAAAELPPAEEDMIGPARETSGELPS